LTVQLASLSALQSSLDILGKHRPDYTPRTGFVWPITDPSIEDPTKKQAVEGEFSLTESETSEVPQDNRKEAPKRQQNNWLLMNAMRTTAAHSKMSFSSSSFVQSTDNLVALADTSATTTMRSSPTPAPASQEPAPKVSIISQEHNKGPIGSGKKKRKRSLTR
jgi:mediator of RNA polymerase II transcription subunit 6